MRLYKRICDLFVTEMIIQLKANAHKHDRKGWLSHKPMSLVLEIYYHTGKLQQAVKENDLDKIKEYSADVANMAMMTLDRCGGLMKHHNIKNPIDSPTAELAKNIIK